MSSYNIALYLIVFHKVLFTPVMCIFFLQLGCQVAFSIVSHIQKILIYVCCCHWCLITVCTILFDEIGQERTLLSYTVCCYRYPHFLWFSVFLLLLLSVVSASYFHCISLTWFSYTNNKQEMQWFNLKDNQIQCFQNKVFVNNQTYQKKYVLIMLWWCFSIRLH